MAIEEYKKRVIKRINEGIHGADSAIREIMVAMGTFSKENFEKLGEIFANREFDKFIKLDEKNVSKEYLALRKNYFNKVVTLMEELIRPEFSQKKNLLNVLEYIRMMCMYENINIDSASLDINEKWVVKVLSGLPIVLLETGQGICSAQATLMRDILLLGFIESEVITEYLMDPEMESLILDSHSVVWVNSEEYGEFILDPTKYKGTLNSLMFPWGNTNIKCEYDEEYDREYKTFLDVSEEDILQSRRFVSDILIKKLEIDSISEKLGLNDEKKDILEKQCIIFMFISSKINLTPNLDTKTVTANINGVNIEVGKLMELFFYCNNIDYEIFKDTDLLNEKRETIYAVKIGYSEEENGCLLHPQTMFSGKDGQLIGLHYNSQGEYLFKTSTDLDALYGEYLRGAKKIVQDFNAGNYCIGDDDDDILI